MFQGLSKCFRFIHRSYPEIAFYCFGKTSIYIVNILVLIAFGILPIAYLIIFADIFKTIVAAIFKLSLVGDDISFWVTRVPWVLAISTIILPLILKKHLAELKIASVMLFSGAALFAILTTLQLIIGIEVEYQDFSGGKA
jgi:amino acid permease